jgi:outer membrane protein assembly factor BamB
MWKYGFILFGMFLFCGLSYSQEVAGLLKWAFSAKGIVASSACAGYGRVYFGSGEDIFYCLDATNGKLLWSFQTGNPSNNFLSNPLLKDGKIYFGSYSDKKFYCLDAFSGESIWEFQCKGEIESSARINDGKIYFGSWDNKIYCLNVSNGEKIWDFKADAAVRSSPFIINGKVCFGSFGRKFYCLDALSGDKIWEFQTEGQNYASPIGDGERIYFGSKDKQFYCLDAIAGKKLWSYKSGDIIVSSAFLLDGRVYFGAYDDKMTCLDALSGSNIWEFQTGGDIDSSPSVVDGKIYFGSYDKKFYAIDAVSGEKIWDFEMENIVESSPCVVNGLVYFGGDDEQFYCIDSGNPDATAGNSLSGQDYSLLKLEEAAKNSIALETENTVSVTNHMTNFITITNVVKVKRQDRILLTHKRHSVSQLRPHYSIQVGAFLKARNAVQLYSKLKRMGYPAYKNKMHGKSYIRVRVGNFVSYTDAWKKWKTLERKGITGIIIEL